MKVILRMLKERRRSLKNKSVPFSYVPSPFLIVYSATGGDVRDVIINGKIVYRERRFTTLDSEEIMNQVKSLRRDIGR
jgi:cytosine/adenosine deaminase-related metal-dependent hydrolase